VKRLRQANAIVIADAAEATLQAVGLGTIAIEASDSVGKPEIKPVEFEIWFPASSYA
jgi:hypothetical protein